MEEEEAPPRGFKKDNTLLKKNISLILACETCLHENAKFISINRRQHILIIVPKDLLTKV